MTPPRWFRKCSGPARSRAPGWRHRWRITCLAPSGEGALYLGTAQGELWHWRPSQEKPDLLYAAESRAALLWLAANGEHVACAWADGRSGVLIEGTMRELEGPCDPRHLVCLIAWPESMFIWICAGGSAWISRGEVCYPAVLPIRDPLRTAASDLPNRRVLLGCEDGRLILWEPRTQPELNIVRLPGAAVRLASGPGDHVLALDADGDVHHFHANCISTLSRRESAATSLAVLPGGVLVTGHRLAWGEGAFGEVVARTSQGERRLAVHRDTVLSLEALPNGRLAAAGADGLVVVWDVGRDRSRVVSRHEGPATLLAALSGGGVASAAGTAVRQWLPAARREQAPSAREMLSHPAAVVLSDGRVGSADTDGTLWLRDPSGAIPDMVYAAEEPIVSLSFDEEFVLVCGLESGAVLRLGIEPEYSQRLARAALLPVAAALLLPAVSEPPSTVIVAPSPAEQHEVYPHHTRVRRLDVAPHWTTWRTRTPDGRHWAVRLVTLPRGSLFDLDVAQRYRRRTAGLPHSAEVDCLERRGDSLAVLAPAPTETLRERFNGRPATRRGLPRRDLLNWLDGVAEGLDDLWQRHRMPHLDLTPLNVWLDGERARLFGWGLVPAGLPSSAALPPGERDGAADQVCLARLYSEMLTGRTPDAELSALHPLERPIVRRALDADPARRFASCRSFLAALRKAAGGIVEADSVVTERFGASDGAALTIFVGGADDAVEERSAFTAVLRRWQPTLSRAGLTIDVITRGPCVRPAPESLAEARLAIFFVTDRAGLPLDDRDSPLADTFQHDLMQLPRSACLRVYYRDVPPAHAPRESLSRHATQEQLLVLLEQDLEMLTGLEAAPPPEEGEMVTKATSQARRPYLLWMAEQHRTIELPGLRKAGLRSVNLDLVYVALRGDRTSVFERVQERELLLAQADESLGGDLPEEERRRRRGQLLRDNPTMLTLAERDRPDAPPGETLDLAAPFTQERCLVLLGDPGSGKTTLLRWLALRLSEALLTGSREVAVPRRQVDPDGPEEGTVSLGPIRLPVLLRAADFADELARATASGEALTLEDYLGRHAWQGHRPTVPDVDHEIPSDLLNNLIRSHLRAGRAVILIDGLDEIGAGRAGQREDVLRAVETFIEDWIDPGRRAGRSNGNRIVLTSRIAGYHVAPLTSPCAAHFTIEPMSRSAVERFLGGWGAAAGAPSGEIESLKQAIFDPATPGVAELASNPLLVTILALVYRTKKGLPPRRAELYEEAIRALVEGWPDVPPGDLEPLAEVLGPLAWHVHEHYPTGLIEQAELIERLQQTSGSDSPRAWRMRPEELVDVLRENVGLLAARGDTLFGFLHLTFQEYFVALELIRDRASAATKILERISEPRWREPILLSLGLASRRWPATAFYGLLTTLLDDDPSRTAHQLPGAAWLLVLALPEVGELPRPLVRRVVARLLAPSATRDCLGRFPSLRARLEESLLRLRQSAPDATEDALCEALADPARAAATASLLQQQTWFSPRLAEALLAALPHDDEARGFPIASCLLELASPPVPPRPLAASEPVAANVLEQKKKHEAELIQARQRVLARIVPLTKLREDLRTRSELPLASLAFRAALEAEPLLEGAIRTHVGWLSLVGATYGGYADHQAAAIEAEHARLAAFLLEPDAVRQTKIDQHPDEYLTHFGAADPTYQVAVYLDGKMAGRRAHVTAPVAFSPSAIWRDAPATLTRRLLGVLRAGGTPKDVNDDLRELWHAGDVETRAAAATALAASGDEWIIDELDAALDDPTRRDVARRSLTRMAQSAHGLRDAVVRSVPLVLAAVAELVREPGEGQEIATALLRAVSRATDVPPDLTAIVPEAAPPLRGALAADAWYRLARGWGIDDPILATATLRDSAGGASLVEVLTQAHLAPSRRAQPDAWAVEPIPPLSDAPGLPMEAIEALAALRIDHVPPDLQARLRGDLLARLLGAFVDRPDVQMELRPLAAATWEAAWPGPQVREAARGLADPYRQARVLLRLLDAAPEDEMLLEQTRTIALAIPEPLSRCRVRERLLRFIPDERFMQEIASLAADVNTIADADERCRAFARLAARSEAMREELMGRSLGAALLISDPARRASTLALLLPLASGSARLRDEHRAAAVLSGWQRARARELEGLSLSGQQSLAAHVAAAPQAWAAVFAFAALTDLVAHHRTTAGADDAWSRLAGEQGTEAIRQLLDTGEERGLFLTPTAARALGTLLASPSPQADEAATALLPLVQAPAAESWPILNGWLTHPDDRLSQHAALVRAEAPRRLDETTIPALASLLGSGLDRSRLRAQVVLWSNVLAVEKRSRGLRVSQVGRRAIDLLAAERASLVERGEMAARSLYRFWGDVTHDDPEALLAWADQAARPGRESAQALWILGNVEELAEPAWPVFQRLLGEPRPLPVRKALLRSLCSLAFLEGKLPAARWQAMQPELERFRKEDWSGQRTFLSPEETIVEALRAARSAEQGGRARLAEQALTGMTATFTELLSRQGDELLRTLRQLGERFYLPMDDDSRGGRMAAEVEKEPALFAVLLSWLGESLAGAPDDHEGWHPKVDWLLRIAAPAAERMPAAFLRQTATGAGRWRDLLARAARRQEGAYARRAAVVLLGLLREATAPVADAFRSALRDVPVVQDAAVRAAERFVRIDEALEAFIGMLLDDSALTAYGAARVLSALGRAERRPAAQRGRIVAGLAAALDRPLAWRSTYRLLGRGTAREPARVVRGVRLERALHQALLEVGGWS